MIKIGYLGPKGTYTEKAAKKYFTGIDKEMRAYRTLPELFSAVKSGEIDKAVAPIENSIEGSVNQTLDLLAQEKGVAIQGEIILTIKHALMAKPGVKVNEITKVISHGQALAQCSRFLETFLPDAALVEAVSTAEAAVQIVNSDQPWAVIGNPDIGEIYSLNILEYDIQNCTANRTRFVILGQSGQPITNANKTSILISITDRPGGLYQVLKEFALVNINLTKIESRPAKNKLGNYIFFIDFMGNPADGLVEKCLNRVREMTAEFRILGIYKGAETAYSYSVEKSVLNLEQVREDIDIIDRQIVELLAMRTQLVKIIADLKGAHQKIRDRKREEQILERLTAEARKKGVSPKLIKELYNLLFTHFVGLQKIRRQRGKAYRQVSTKQLP
ncbi:prephenate dehydratase [Thermincola potens]|uniref:Prephenate dehydratase n=1 Tax=Thermincola potens (strain JR) TaxID=635013 RepID=D5X8W8_THEPJ|nr:prephenate dehydratase [Thermincola potens]ADG80968.1 Prephenate dehydratase [Thermincola potens JR]